MESCVCCWLASCIVMNICSTSMSPSLTRFLFPWNLWLFCWTINWSGYDLIGLIWLSYYLILAWLDCYLIRLLFYWVMLWFDYYLIPVLIVMWLVFDLLLDCIIIWLLFDLIIYLSEYYWMGFHSYLICLMIMNLLWYMLEIHNQINNQILKNNKINNKLR